MEIVPAAVFILLVNGFAVLMWLGALSWLVDFEPDARRLWDVGMPWLTVGFDVMLLGVYLRRTLGFGSSADPVFMVPGLSLFALGCVVAVTGHPHWALPRWYQTRTHHGSYRSAPPMLARTFAQRLRRDHVMWFAVLVPVVLATGYYGALAGCSRGASTTACVEAINAATLGSLAAGGLLAIGAYRLGWLSTRRGPEGQRVRASSRTALGLSVLLAPAVYGLFRMSSFGLEVAPYTALDGLIVVIALLTAGRVVALLIEDRRASAT